MRRGILYTTAQRLGCNKIALGHHRDDALETLLLNLFYAGKLQALPAGYTTDDGRFAFFAIEPGAYDLVACTANGTTIRSPAASGVIASVPMSDGWRAKHLGALLFRL